MIIVIIIITQFIIASAGLNEETRKERTNVSWQYLITKKQNDGERRGKEEEEKKHTRTQTHTRNIEEISTY